MHIVGGDVVQHALVVGNEQDTQAWSGERVHTIGYDLESIDIQAGVGLIHHCDLWFEQRHLENLGSLLFTSVEAVVHGPANYAFIHLDQAHLLLWLLPDIPPTNT